MQWVVKAPARFLLEKTELEKLVSEGWLSCAWHITRNGSVQVDIDINVHGRVFEGRLFYPDMFPNSPAYIRPRGSSELWSGHQYGPGGSLCLEWRADNWHPDITGAEVIRSAFRLLTSEQHPEAPVAVPSAHRLTIGQDLRQQKSRFVSTPTLFATLAGLPNNSSGELQTVTVTHRELTVRFISQLSSSDSKKQIDDLPEGLAQYFPLFTWTGIGWVFRSSTFASIDALRSSDELLSAVQSAGFDATPMIEALRDTSNPVAPLVVLVADDPAALDVYSLERGEPRELRSHAVLHGSSSATRAPADASQLAELRIGIVGLGSMGSKMAVSLARAGVRKFVLVDDDILLPENLARHELSWAAVGVHKVNGLYDALRLTAPHMDIIVRTHRVAGQESPAASAAVLNDLARCDLIVDATANPEVFLVLAAVAQSAQRSMMWMEVFAGSYGGLIARARPSHDPNPLAVRDAIYAYFDSQPPAPYKRATGYDDTGDELHRAFDSDVSYVTAAATKLALDTVLAREPSEFPYSVYLLGLRKDWIFEQPFETRPIEVKGAGWETDQGSVGPEILEEALKTAVAMIEPDPDADNHATA